MTINEFLNEFERLYKSDPDAKPEIGKLIRINVDGRLFCPLTYWRYRTTGAKYRLQDFDLAAPDDMDWKDIIIIVRKADDAWIDEMEVRNRLLEIVNG